MKKFILLITILAALISCRNDDDLMPTENELKKENKNNELYLYDENQSKNDTINWVQESDPPVKDGNHWKDVNNNDD
jgi:hypothetical protein